MTKVSDLKLRKKIFDGVSLVTATFGCVWSLMYLFLEEYPGAIVVGSYSLLTFLNFLIFRKLSSSAKTLYAIQTVLILLLPGSVQVAIGGFYEASGVIFATVLAPLGALLFYNNKVARKILYGFIIIVISAGAIEYFLLTEKSNKESLFSLGFFIINYIIIAIIIFFILEYFVKSRNTTQGILEQKNKDLQDSLAYASRIQKTFIASEHNLNEVFPKSSLLYLPKETVSGDFCWISKIDNTVYFTVADCTGHGVPGAMVSLIGLHAIDQTINKEKISEPKNILTNVSNIFVQHFSQQKIRIQDGMDISFCTLNLSNNKLKYAGAMASILILRNSSILTEEIPSVNTYIEGSTVIYELKPDRKPIGIDAFNYGFNEVSFQIELGDRIVMFTDGYLDQFGGEKSKKFKKTNFKKLLVDHMRLDPVELRKELNTTLQSWRGSIEQTDDVCVVVIDI